ncbi:hydrogenase expression/formation protein HypE [Desulfobacterales bacterium HSG16]|nr:hydrogenase expression/formation protein HypE [Desulfobacterales bacterium HSG16]
MNTDKILLDHGSGGKMSHELITRILLPNFDNPALSLLDDGAVFDINTGKLAFSTDSYVIDPIFFPGGCIGDLAVNGTVNDIAMCGAIPLYLSAGMIIEEGFSIKDLEKIVHAMAKAAKEAGVDIVTGDTKVVPKGSVDKIFINTAGVGSLPDNVNVSGHRAMPGDKILISGTIADHGMAILTQREGLSFDSEIKTDSAPLNHMVKKMLKTCPDIHVLRDPTRGGVATTLNEIAGQSKTGIRIYEDKLPVRPDVAGVCELLGFDPLYVANEGKLLAAIPSDAADMVLDTVKNDIYGKDACIIGEVTTDHPGKVFLQTRIGGTRIVDMLTGEQLPRIC